MADMPRYRVDEAIALILAATPHLRSEQVDAMRSIDRVVAGDTMASADLPPFRAAAMDGYAVNSNCFLDAGIDHPVTLRLTDHTGPAGSWPPTLSAGCAMPISTGAPVPEGSDCVIAREHGRVKKHELVVDAPWRAGTNVRSQGEDVALGSVVARQGDTVGPELLALFVAARIPQVSVFRRPRILLLSTGTELGAHGAAGIADSNAPMIAALLDRLHPSNCSVASVPDDPAAIRHAIQSHLDADLIISTGGVSHGDHDLVRGVIEQLDGRVVFHGIAMRPGKPMLFAQFPNGCLFFGLPGNPVAALVGFRFFVAAAIRAMVGKAPDSGQVVETDYPGREGTTLFLRSRVVDAANGPALDLGLDQRSHILSSAAASDFWVSIDQRSGVRQVRRFDKYARA